MINPEEYFQKKWSCKFQYEGDQFSEQFPAEETVEIDGDFLKKVVYGEDKLRELKLAETKKEMSNLRSKEKELQ